MLRIFANNHYSTFSFDYFAFVTNFFNRWSDFHVKYLLLIIQWEFHLPVPSKQYVRELSRKAKIQL